MATTNQQVRRNKARRKKYTQNIFAERAKSRLRARAKKLERTPAEVSEHLARHREAQARYRMSRRAELAEKSRQYRQRKADERERTHDEELVAEFELMWNEGHRDATLEQAAERLTQKTGRRYKV